jgi:hypothetical protein
MKDSYTKEECLALEHAGFWWNEKENRWTIDKTVYRQIYKKGNEWTLYTNYGFDHETGEDNENWETFSTINELFDYFI